MAQTADRTGMNRYNINEVQSYLSGRLCDNSNDKWFFYPDELAVIIQIEPLLSQELLFYISLEKQGGGSFLSPFMTLLMIEDITSIFRPEIMLSEQKKMQAGLLPLGVVSGSVSETFFAIHRCRACQAGELAVLLYEFTESVRFHAHPLLHDTSYDYWNPRIASLAEIRLNHLMSEMGEK